ncbi:MAG: hypothetical protein CBB60_008625 [Armatimonadetes bacterium Cent15-Ar3]|nr:MAG: hypothetical protein CBB60_008625 [Armatimonadetes bacterium Cent15-Ar3]
MRRERGSALMMGVTAVFGCMMIGISVVGLQASETYKAQRVRKQAQAFALAESGVEYARRWLLDQAAPPAGTQSIGLTDNPIELGEGTFTVSVVPDLNNPTNRLKTYILRSTGQVDGVTQNVDVKMRSQSFGRYAYFSDQESANPMSSPIWFGQRDKIRGPFFTNNSNFSWTNIDNTNPQRPIFDASVDMNGDRINYMQTAPRSDADFLALYSLGRSAVKLAVDRIELPSTTTVQANAAWGATSGHPTTQGVYVPATGGIYVVGSASVLLEAPSQYVQVVKITQGSTTTTVSIDLASKQTTITTPTNTSTRAGIGTGVLFVTGDITSLKGTMANSINGATPVKSAMTIAADAAAGKNITITGDVEYLTPSNPDIAPDQGNNLVAGIMGLYANKIRVGTAAGANVRIDGLVMAGSSVRSDGGFGADSFDSRSPGTLIINGGLIQKVRGPVGTFRGSTQVSGFIKDYYYDERMMDTPPPFFPTTGKYDMLNWKQK